MLAKKRNFPATYSEKDFRSLDYKSWLNELSDDKLSLSFLCI